jgi:hypothetical protein
MLHALFDIDESDASTASVEELEVVLDGVGIEAKNRGLNIGMNVERVWSSFVGLLLVCSDGFEEWTIVGTGIAIGHGGVEVEVELEILTDSELIQTSKLCFRRWRVSESNLLGYLQTRRNVKLT